jgi:hypothetical protein
MAAGRQDRALCCQTRHDAQGASLTDNGFATIAGKHRLGSIDLWALASKNQMSEVIILELVGRVKVANLCLI